MDCINEHRKHMHTNVNNAKQVFALVSMWLHLVSRITFTLCKDNTYHSTVICQFLVMLRSSLSVCWIYLIVVKNYIINQWCTNHLYDNFMCEISTWSNSVKTTDIMSKKQFKMHNMILLIKNMQNKHRTCSQNFE